MGARPGCPLADLIFALGYAIGMRDFMARLVELDLIWCLPLAEDGCFSSSLPTSEVRLPPICYVDDTAVLVEASSAVKLVGRMALVVNMLLEVTRRHGLQLKFSERKTEVVISVAGDGPRAGQKLVAELETT